MILKKLDKEFGIGEWLSKEKKNVKTTKKFLIQLQRPIAVKVELNC